MHAQCEDGAALTIQSLRMPLFFQLGITKDLIISLLKFNLCNCDSIKSIACHFRAKLKQTNDGRRVDLTTTRPTNVHFDTFDLLKT